jgi:N-acyl-D-amino-acid deacylase
MSLTCDLLIGGGTVIDGTGAPGFAADVAVADDRIVAVGPDLARRVVPGRRIDVAGRVVAPGFIDVHTHDDRALLSHPEMPFKVSQGVTTLVAGNCGVSMAPLVLPGQPPPPLDLLGFDPGWFRFDRFADYHRQLRETPPAVNCGLLVGHITLRHRVGMDRFDRAADAREIASMAGEVDQAMAAGAIGFSTGLDYPDSVHSSEAEVTALASRVRPFGGMCCCHHRDYFAGLDEALSEVFRIGRAAGVPMIVSHHQCTGAANFGKAPGTLDRISQARRETPIGLDVYPYSASSKTLDPARAQPGVRIMVTWSTPHPELAGRMLHDIAAELGCSSREAAERILPAGAIYFQLDEQDVQAILRYPHTMIGSDGLPHDVHPHPRLWGTFPRVLGQYVRELGLLTLPDAVRRMTSLPAAWFGFADRGRVAAGAFADLVVFDPETVIDTATFTHPAQPAQGIELVVCNGRITWEGGAHTGARPGKVLARDPAAAITRPDA